VRVERVADGVHAVLRTDPPGLMFEANGVVIVGDGGVAVVDGGSNPASARAMLAVVRRLTALPVAYVINTHWHDDHVLGNQVWRDAYPAAEVVAHATAAEDLRTDGATNRRLMIENGPKIVAGMRARMAKGEGLDGAPLSDEERVSHASTIALAEHHLSQAATFRTVPPTRTVDDSLTLRLGARTLVLRHLGRAHTRGDVVVHVPDAGVVVAGDLVAWPVPLVGSTSFPLDYGATLERLVALRPRRLVPGHGPVLDGDAYPRLLVRLLASVAEQTRAAVARGETLEQARRSVRLDAFRRELAGSSRVRALLFDTYVAGPAVARAYEAATQGG
jgi:glyoxylase-like metal-dependent hydrolase (beta-lactamase superfamily II)